MAEVPAERKSETARLALFQSRPVKIDRAAEAFFEIDFRVIAEMLLSCSDVCPALADVAGSGGLVLGLNLGAQEFVERGDEIQKRNCISPGDVEDASRDLFC